MCSACFPWVTYLRSLLIERGTHRVDSGFRALFCKRISDISERPEEITYYTQRVPCSVSEDLT